MEFIIVTGLSGSGKSGVINALEDIGFYCIDNMPPQLIPKFGEICLQSEGKISRVAIGADIRGGELFFHLSDNLTQLRVQGVSIKILFLDAADDVLIKRYKETRRKHPLDELASGNIARAVAAERDLLTPIRESADYYIDTSLLSTSQLKERINSLFLENVGDSMIVSCMSFGFKYGIPTEADLVFDVRCLPNPYYIPELKHKTGMEPEVREFVMKHEQAIALKDKLEDLVRFLLPLYVKEGKSQLVIAFGCTGGKHRSVTFAENMYRFLVDNGFKARVSHRDIYKD